MARLSFKLPDDFLLKVSKLSDRTDEIIPRVLQAGGEVMLDKVKSNLNSAVGKDTKYPSRSTGQLENALGMSPVLQDKDGNHNIKIGFAEPRRDGISNAMLANLIEYGKSGQPAKPFLKPARTTGRKPSIEAMRKKLEDEVSNI